MTPFPLLETVVRDGQDSRPFQLVFHLRIAHGEIAMKTEISKCIGAAGVWVPLEFPYKPPFSLRVPYSPATGLRVPGRLISENPGGIK